MDKLDEDLRCIDCKKPDDDAHEPELCTACNGSGEGMYDGTKCSYCGGRGTISLHEDDHDYEEDDDREDEVHVPRTWID